MTDDTPLVSVIIPTYYRDETLRAAIESVQRQTHKPIEIIVVDDSGERYAADIVTDLDVRYVAHQTNRGGNPARTTGFERSNGRYVQFLDDDDRLYERKIERQIAVVEAADDIGVVYCNLHYETDKTQPACDHRGDVLYPALQFDLNPCQTGTMLIAREVLHDLMPLANRAAADDIGLKIRLAERTRFDYVDEALFWKGDTGNHRADTAAFADELEKMIRSDHAQLYAAAPDYVRNRALYKMHRFRGFKTLANTRWSWQAIVAFGAALRYTHHTDLTDFATFALSLLGAPGLSLGGSVRNGLANLLGRA